MGFDILTRFWTKRAVGERLAIFVSRQISQFFWLVEFSFESKAQRKAKSHAKTQPATPRVARVRIATQCVAGRGCGAVRKSARDNYSIRHALARQDYGSALALTKREFASVRSGGEAANLIHVIVASAPAVRIPPLVTAAVEANPQYGQEVVQAAIEGASPSERVAIVTSVYFALSQNPSTPKPLLDYVSDLAHGHSVPTNSAGTVPWFNTGASVGHNKG